ncbi:MAG: AAA family ATPase [Clostridia bacterium]|nr:AAA family ATPase [Clostridia bacterium]
MLVILSGVAGAGKDTIIKEITKKMNNVCTVPAYTTREPRADDIPGVSYNFVTKKEFEELINNGDIYEYDIHHNNYYGTSKHLINEKAKNGIVIKDIDVNGTEKLKEVLRDMGIKVVTIFLRVPKHELQRRLENRIDKLSHEEIKLRLNRFDYEESKMDVYDYVMKNDNLEKALSIIQTIIEQEYKEETKEN